MDAPNKKSYVVPELETHGTIEALTGQGSATDVGKLVDGPRTLAEERPFRS